MSTAHTEQSERQSLAPPPTAPLHPRSFKLRFASQSATVTDKFHRRESATPAAEPLQRVHDMFHRGPRDKFTAPLTSSHEYGWWVANAHSVRRCERGGGAARLDHRIRDSAWLKERVRVLAADAGYKR